MGRTSKDFSTATCGLAVVRSKVKMENVVGIRVQIHHVALFTIVDSYERRQDASRRVIGTLLGVKERAGLVEIRSGYPVPHNETEEEVRGSKARESGSKNKKLGFLPRVF